MLELHTAECALTTIVHGAVDVRGHVWPILFSL